MDKFYWTYKTPKAFTDMIMYSDGRFLTGLVFEKSSDGFRNRWDNLKRAKHVAEPINTKYKVSEQNVMAVPDAAAASNVFCAADAAAVSYTFCAADAAADSNAFCAADADADSNVFCTSDAATASNAFLTPDAAAAPNDVTGSAAVTALSSTNDLQPPFCEMERKLLPVFENTIQWLDLYFGKNRETGEFTEKSVWPDFVPAIKIAGLTPFRRKVISAMISIPFGQTMTYGEIAKAIGKEKMSARAVGGAVGWNPICLIIPCHRVLGTNGSITGYGGGINNKIALLQLEGIML